LVERAGAPVRLFGVRGGDLAAGTSPPSAQVKVRSREPEEIAVLKLEKASEALSA
jgi:hypothetical protein